MSIRKKLLTVVLLASTAGIALTGCGSTEEPTQTADPGAASASAVSSTAESGTVSAPAGETVSINHVKIALPDAQPKGSSAVLEGLTATLQDFRVHPSKIEGSRTEYAIVRLTLKNNYESPLTFLPEHTIQLEHAFKACVLYGGDFSDQPLSISEQEVDPENLDLTGPSNNIELQAGEEKTMSLIFEVPTYFSNGEKPLQFLIYLDAPEGCLGSVLFSAN